MFNIDFNNKFIKFWIFVFSTLTYIIIIFKKIFL